MTLPERVSIDAWAGGATVASPLDPRAAAWGVEEHAVRVPQLLVADEPADLRDWQDEAVGWGLVLRDNDGLDQSARATAADAPAAIQELVASRGGVVLRWREGHTHLLRYTGAAKPARIPMGGNGDRGRKSVDALPHYLLLYGGPAEIPWSVQYVLNGSCFVGRLHLTGEPLERYVHALMSGWRDSACRPTHPLVWSTDDGTGDITAIMRGAIGEPVYRALAGDTDIGANARLLAGKDATASELSAALRGQRPALVVSTSHGLTDPLDDPAAMASRLGALVDVAGTVIDPAQPPGGWDPDGAIWYGHACCSAGSDAVTSFAGLAPAGSQVQRTLDAITHVGATVSPLPTALLGANRPLRAFVGHVEPTFDWTLRAPDTGQLLTASLVSALYDSLHRKRPETIGMAFRRWFTVGGSLLAQWRRVLGDVNNFVPRAEVSAVRLQLAAVDRQTLVILGDPTVSPPPLGGV